MVGRNVAFTADKILCDKKEVFLSNPQNKQEFLYLLGSAFETKGIRTCHAKGDADCLIVQEALKASQLSPTVVIGEDTDLLILLLYHVETTSHDVFFTSGSGKKQQIKLWDIKATQARLGRDVCSNILFAHAMCGCDTTSRPFNIAKSLPLKKLKFEEFVRDAQVFLKPKCDHDSIEQAGERLFVMLYNGRLTDNLDSLRHIRYQQKLMIGGKTQVQAKCLPPTSSAARYHSYRVYFQVQEWATLGKEPCLEPEDWGWELRDNQLLPVTTNQPPAPPDLLNMIRCNCKKDCATGKCSCRKHGLACTTACGECRGNSCSNSVQFEDSDSDM